jgi:2-oxoglutarate/2-oxoacid ferredoxin oxidoreductase subunit beta
MSDTKEKSLSEKSVESFNIRDYLRTDLFPHFLCPGCGHGIALRALLWAVHDLDIDKNNLAIVSGIGCSGRTGAYIDANTFHTTHGRPLAFATGLALARPDLKVIVITGDGDCLAIGGNHLIHASRRNLDITCMMLNNEVYGMTGGQASPTTSATRFTTTTPSGAYEPVFDACKLAEAAGAGFVGREVTIQTPTLKNLLKDAIDYAGFSFVEVMSDCTEIFGRKNDLGESAEMILSQKAVMRPTSYGPLIKNSGDHSNAVDQPFRPNALKTGILAQNDRPEYGATLRAHTKKVQANRK